MIRVTRHYYLDEYSMTDRDRLAETINDKEIARNTLTVPFPYTLKDAEWWLTEMGIRKNTDQPQKNWAIRNDEGLVCGGIGLHFKYGQYAHKDEIGYWLMRDLWNQGLMTKVVKRFCDHCFEELDLIRLEAPIFEFNKGSRRVLEKSGFSLEGLMRKAYLKGGVYYDSLLFARISEYS